MTGPTCHEGVTRAGEYQPCEKPAVAERLDARLGQPPADYSWYPVCTTHTRGTCRPLTPEPPRLIQTRADLDELPDGAIVVHEFTNTRGETVTNVYQKSLTTSRKHVIWYEAGDDFWTDSGGVYLPAVLVWPVP